MAVTLVNWVSLAKKHSLSKCQFPDLYNEMKNKDRNKQSIPRCLAHSNCSTMLVVILVVVDNRISIPG